MLNPRLIIKAGPTEGLHHGTCVVIAAGMTKLFPVIHVLPLIPLIETVLTVRATPIHRDLRPASNTIPPGVPIGVIIVAVVIVTVPVIGWGIRSDPLPFESGMAKAKHVEVTMQK